LAVEAAALAVAAQIRTSEEVLFGVAAAVLGVKLPQLLRRQEEVLYSGVEAAQAQHLAQVAMVIPDLNPAAAVPPAHLAAVYRVVPVRMANVS
jgi:hypothetical protein